MEKRLLILSLIFASIILFANSAFAEIVLSQPRNVYNIGDSLSVNVLVHPSSSTTDFLIVRLKCSQGAVEIYRNTLILSSSETREIVIESNLGLNIVGSSRGLCNLEATYNGETMRSQDFELTDEIDIQSSLQGVFPAGPSDKIVIQGSAYKKNGQLVNGLVNVKIEDRLLKSALITNGTFSLEIILENDISAGQHRLVVEVVEKDNGGRVTNMGKETKSINIKAVLRKIQIVIEPYEADPGSALRYKIEAYDQTNQLLNRDLRLKIFDSNDKLVHESLSVTGRENSFYIGNEGSAGYWRVEADINGMIEKKLFYVKELELVSFEMIDNVLNVKNIGNVPYVKTVEIIIGEYSALKDINLKVGEVKRFKLSAPENLYDIFIKDGFRDWQMSSVPLTGRVIGVDDLSSGSFNRFALWFILIIIVALGIVSNVFIRKKLRINRDMKNIKADNKLYSKSIKSLPSEEWSDLKGIKESANALALVTNNGNDAIKRVLDLGKERGAHVYKDGEHYVMLFSQGLTKNTNPDFLAVKTAHEISCLLEKQKGDFGIGVSKGEFVSSKKDREFSFSSLTNFIPNAKKMSKDANKEILISNDLYVNVMGSIKAEKSREKNAWKLKSVIDRGAQGSFISGFLKRNKFE